MMWSEIIDNIICFDKYRMQYSNELRQNRIKKKKELFNLCEKKRQRKLNHYLVGLIQICLLISFLSFKQLLIVALQTMCG